MEPPEQEESWRENSGIYKARFEIIEGMLHKGVGLEKQKANLELLYESQRSINFEITYLSEKLDSGLSMLLSLQLDLEGQQHPRQEHLEQVQRLTEMNERLALEIERLTASRDEVLILICQYEDISHHDDEALARSLQAEVLEKPVVRVPKKFLRDTPTIVKDNIKVDPPVRHFSNVSDLNPIFEIDLNLRILQKNEYKIAKLPSGKTAETYISNRFYKAKGHQVELAFLRFKYESWPEGMSWHDWLLARMATIADPKTLLRLWGLFWATISNYDVQEIYLSRPKCVGEFCKLQHKRWLQHCLSLDASCKRSGISPSEARARLVYWQQEQVAEICGADNANDSLSVEDLLKADNIHFVSTLASIHRKLRDDFIRQIVYCITSDFLKKVKPGAIAFLWATVANFEQSNILNSWLSSVLVQTVAPLVYQNNQLYYTGWKELSRAQLDQLISEL